MEVTKISEQAIQKALETLGLKKAEEAAAPVVEKTEAEIAKEKLQAEYNDTIKKAEELKNAIEGKESGHRSTCKNCGGTGWIFAKVKEEPTIQKAEVVELSKAVDDKLTAIATLIQSKNDEISSLKDANGELKKAVDNVVAFNNELAKQLKIVAQQPLDRKSVATQTFLEKGEDTELNKAAGLRTLNISDKAQRAELSDIMFNAAVKDGKVVDREFEKAITPLELGSIGSTPAESARITKRLKEEFKIIVTK